MRIRYEGYDDDLWGDPPAPDEGYLWLRVMPHANWEAMLQYGHFDGGKKGASGQG